MQGTNELPTLAWWGVPSCIPHVTNFDLTMHESLSVGDARDQLIAHARPMTCPTVSLSVGDARDQQITHTRPMNCPHCLPLCRRCKGPTICPCSPDELPPLAWGIVPLCRRCKGWAVTHTRPMNCPHWLPLCRRCKGPANYPHLPDRAVCSKKIILLNWCD